MFHHFDYFRYGFTDEEWDEIPRVDKVIIRDYALNGGDRDQTMWYGYYETIYQVRKAEKEYHLDRRPKIHFSYTDFNLVS